MKTGKTKAILFIRDRARSSEYPIKFSLNSKRIRRNKTKNRNFSIVLLSYLQVDIANSRKRLTFNFLLSSALEPGRLIGQFCASSGIDGNLINYWRMSESPTPVMFYYLPHNSFDYSFIVLDLLDCNYDAKYFISTWNIILLTFLENNLTIILKTNVNYI